MSPFLKGLISAGALAVLAGVASSHAAPMGIAAGHLSIVSPKEVELADGNAATVTAETYAKYPLIILSRAGKEVTRVIADATGNYRVALSPGDYVLDVQGRARGHVRAKPQPFTVVSSQTVRVDLNIDTGIR
jgi:hypothetical protein